VVEVKPDITICQLNKDNMKNIIDEKIIYIRLVYLNNKGMYTKILAGKRELFTERKADTIIEYIYWETMAVLKLLLLRAHALSILEITKAVNEMIPMESMMRRLHISH
jgi:hypothetical protein